MDPITLCNRYFDAWNRRDADAVLATLAPGGTYSDPTTGGPLAAPQLRGYMQGLWSAFPDLGFELGEVALAGAGRVVGRWRMKGTNSGSMNGLPPSGRAIDLHGVDLISVGARGIDAIDGYFDSTVVPRQLGLQVLVQPTGIGPFRFGSSVVVRTGNPGRPGCVSTTELVARSDQEVDQIRETSRQIATELLGAPGFIGFTGTVDGRRMRTFTEWESAEAMQAAMRSGTHVKAMREFFGSGYAEGGSTAVWQPLRLGARWRRCPACATMSRIDGDAGTCACGEKLAAVA